MELFRKLARNNGGVAGVEFAIAAPVIFALLFGFAQTGLLFFANAGLQQGVEVGARYATIYPRPTDSQISAKVVANTYGVRASDLAPPTITRGVQNNVPFIEIRLTYKHEFDMAFASFGPITLAHVRRAYQV